jgi:cytochrome c
MPLRHFPICCAAVFAAALHPAFAAGDADKGAALYQARCTACHSLDYNGVGPAHRGTFGRHAGQAPGYAYSAALRAADVVWNEATLDRWLADPEKFIPGQRMGVNVLDAADRADLIAFLKRVGGKAGAPD